MRYTYRCSDCGQVIERDFSLAKNPPSVPCECGMTAFRHFSSAPPIQFKGTGWTREGHGINTSRIPKSWDEAELPGGAADHLTGRD